jgi:Holliday junction resolvasome RuvABC endonuclease subunit
MKNHHPQHIRVLGITPSSYGFGFAVMDGKDSLVNWGVKKVKGKGKNARCLSHVGDLIARYQPDVIAVEDTRSRGSQRSPRVQALIKKIATMAKGEHVKVKRFSRKQMKREFLSNERGTKHDLALHFAARFPEKLGPHLPPKRRAWDNEDHRMDIFDAVALAEHFLQSRA